MKIPSDHMRTLKRRVDFLKSREHQNSFDFAELGALEWAIVNLQPAPVQEPVLKDNSNYRYDPPVAEPVGWKWHQAPVKTQWGDDMVVADIAIDKDHTVSIYCERDQTSKVEAMFTLRKENT
jgi:hypothetical protein